LYNQWFIAEERLRLTSELVNLSEIRFKAIKQRFEGGDRSGMDTLEAFAQVQNRQIQLLDAKQEMLKSRIALVAFINDQDSTKLSMLNLSVFPNKNFKTEIREWSPHFVQLTQINNHPEVLVTETKIDILTLEQRWKKEKLKPKLDIEYRFLQKDFSPLSPGNYSTNNYTWGMQFSAPLFMREARGDLKMQALKITDANLGLEWKKNQIDQKSQQLQATFDFVQEQLKLSEQLANLYQTLLSAENMRFQNGESSVFLLNQRENTFFENQLKLLDFTRKDFQTRIDQAYLCVLPYERIAN
jgi:outer membrane protein TolC